MKENKIKGIVITDNNPDGSVALSLRMLKPEMFAKGGDRKPKEDPMPQS